MIVVRVELWSAVTHKVTEIARLDISNVGGTETKGDYSVRAYRGRSKAAFDRTVERLMKGEFPSFTHYGRVVGYPRKALHVWNLVSLGLQAAGYGVNDEPPSDTTARADRAPAEMGEGARPLH